MCKRHASTWKKDENLQIKTCPEVLIYHFRINMSLNQYDEEIYIPEHYLKYATDIVLYFSDSKKNS